MKKLAVVVLFFVCFSANGQDDTTHFFKVLSDSTAIGTPDGKLVSKEIGTQGGSVRSEDGKVELVFPEGALEKNTTITIQSATNPAPNGAGKSYQFEPSGL